MCTYILKKHSYQYTYYLHLIIGQCAYILHFMRSSYLREPNNPPALGQGAPCAEPLLEEIECGSEDCPICIIDEVEYAVGEMTTRANDVCEKEWYGSFTNLFD